MLMRFDLPVLGASFLVSLVAAAASGVIPALQAAAAQWPRLVRAPGRQGRSLVSKVRWSLVSAEIGLTVMLLAAAISLNQSYLALSRVNAGFDPAGVTTLRIDLSDAVYSPQRCLRKWNDVALREELRCVLTIQWKRHPSRAAGFRR